MPSPYDDGRKASANEWGTDAKLPSLMPACRVAVRRIPGLPVGFFVRCRCTRLRLPLVGPARQVEGLQDPICNALSVRSEVTRSPERKQVHYAHECMLLVYGGEVGLLVPAHPKEGR